VVYPFGLTYIILNYYYLSTSADDIAMITGFVPPTEKIQTKLERRNRSKIEVK
jgi:hypothetical protein